MTACSWILTWFAQAKSGTQESQYVFRIWDYLICSDSSSLVFLISAVLLEMMPANQELDAMTLMENCQDIKNEFALNKDNVEHLIRQAEKVRYMFCRKRDWVDEYNELLLPGSKYRVSYIGMRKILMAASWTSPVFSTIMLLVFFYACSRAMDNSKIRGALTPFYSFGYSLFFKIREIAYFWTNKS